MDERKQKEIDRIKEIADLYLNLKSHLPKYKDRYLDAYIDLANRFDSVMYEK